MSRDKRYYVYIMASRSLTLYTGITGDLYKRALQHKRSEIEGFTKRYHINRLVYYEVFKYVTHAIAREKQIKAWTRAKRLALIKSENPAWQDLAESWGEPIRLQIPRSARDDISNKEVLQVSEADTEAAPPSKQSSGRTLIDALANTEPLNGTVIPTHPQTKPRTSEGSAVRQQECPLRFATAPGRCEWR